MQNIQKYQVAKHIRALFRSRPETFKPSSWECVIRDGRIMLIRSFSREPTDRAVMHWFLELGQSPSLFSIYLAVRRNWQILAEANTEVSGSFDVNGPFLLASNVTMRYKVRGWLANYGRFLSRAKSFIRKTVA